ncbi:MAG: bifunctional diaminohydroxyphosphoribosylaminopyrimidine deaminase/5-amino-6-(5-phosphoribosylamino)uracil reductase RibD [Coriobacteriales bacterium]
MEEGGHMNHEPLMRRALALAAKGAGWVAPNPHVGAVIVRDGTIIGEGWHTAYGELHAEREALADCARRGEDPRGATAYVTLEPCCHTGKQPPCTEALIAAGISRVVMGAPDPNPLVAGKGIRQLRDAGIEVVEGVLVEECRAINRAWLYYIQTKLPFVTMKYAMTLDGKIASCTGDSRWVTGEHARQRVHEDRALAAAIMVGVGTVLADDPLLSARPQGVENPHQPARFVLDSQLRTPADSQLALTAWEQPTYIVCEPDAPASRREELKDAGCKIWTMPAREGRIDLHELLRTMGEKGFQDVIVEGGGQLHGSLLATGMVKRVQAYIAPKLIGGKAAPSPVEGAGIPLMEMALPLQDVSVTPLGSDLLVEGYTLEEEVA